MRTNGAAEFICKLVAITFAVIFTILSLDFLVHLNFPMGIFMLFLAGLAFSVAQEY